MLLLSIALAAGVAGAQEDETDPGQQNRSDAAEASEAVVSALDFEQIVLDETEFTVDEWLAPWNSSREDLGFRRLSSQQLRRLAVSRNGQIAYHLYGLPLRASEQAEMADRLIQADNLPAVFRLLEATPSYAGYGVDYNNNGKQSYTFFFVGKQQSVARQVRQLVDDRSRLKFRYDKKRTRAELISASESIMESGEYLGAQVHSVQLNYATEQLEVLVDPSEIPNVAAPQARTPERTSESSEAITVVEAEITSASGCSSRSNCWGPHRGGTTMVQRGVAGDVRCTGAFTARDTQTNQYVLLTAAHCGDVGSQWTVSQFDPCVAMPPTGCSFVNRHTIDFNPLVSNAVPGQPTTIDYSAPYDIAALGLDGAPLQNAIYRQNSIKLRRIRSSSSDLHIGRAVCLHGFQVGRSCGTIGVPAAGDGYDGLQGIIEPFGVNTLQRDNEQLRFSEGFVFRMRLPGAWTCGADSNNFGTTRGIAGNSGGPVTNGWGSIALGVLSGCSNVEWRNDVTIPAGVAESQITLRAAPIHELLDDGRFELLTSIVNN